MPHETRDITVWLAWRTAPTHEFVASLTPDEHARAHRYRDSADADAFRWSRGLQRVILGAHLRVRAESLVFEQAGRAKPALVTPDGQRCEYNASHSGRLFALAVSDHPVGVDIEQARPMPGLEKVARRVFDPATWEPILAAPATARDALFFTAWTQLEAHAKLHGQGVWRILAHREQHAAAEGVRVASFEAPGGYFGAVAVAGGDPAVTVRWWGAK